MQPSLMNGLESVNLPARRPFERRTRAAAVGFKAQPRQPVHVREANFDDYPDFVLLQSRCGLQARGDDQWRRLWSENPAVQKLGRSLPIGWVLENVDGRVVGCFANIPLTYYFGDQTLLAAAGHSWVVEPAYRGSSLLLLVRFLRQPDVDLFLNTTSNRSAGSAFLSLGARPVPVGRWDMSSCWIVDHRAAARCCLKRAGTPAASLLSCPLGLLGAAGDLMRNASRKAAAAPGADLEFLTGFDVRFDSFWYSLRRARCGFLMADRSREALQWHFRDALSAGQTWIVTASRRSAMAAYAVFCRSDNPGIGLRRMRLVDFQALEGGEALLTAILEGALLRCRSEGIHVLETTGRGVPKMQPFECYSRGRRLAAWSYYYRPASPLLAEILRYPAVWDPSLYDGDASL